MPRAIEMIFVGLAQALDVEFDEQPVERATVQHVELRPGDLALANAVHARPIAGAPRVGELRPVDGEMLLLAKLLAFRDDRRSPIDNRAEGVEYQRLDRGERRLAGALSTHRGGEHHERGGRDELAA